MKPKPSPYHPITPELAAKGLLITLKEAAATEGACEGTMKTNAKTRRLRAYQARFGAPVMVLLSDVETFLKSRPDITSKHHPKGGPATMPAGRPPSTAKPKPKEAVTLPDAEATCDRIGVTIRSLAHATPSVRGLVAKCLIEIADQINETMPADAGNQHQH